MHTVSTSFMKVCRYHCHCSKWSNCVIKVQVLI